MNITIYTSDHCCSCKEAIRFFQESGINFRQLDVGCNKENFDEMLRLGGIATPFIVVDKRKFHSFDREKMEKVLKDGNG
jgi:glutaredoxin